MKKIKLIDLFSGAGGLTLGFVENNFEILETIEIWKPALDTYNYNFNTSATPKDITDDRLRENIAKIWKNKTDLIIGGFPCQGYSIAGKRNPNDPRNKLYKFTIDMINKIKPKVFVLENVKGLLSFKDKDGVLIINKIKKELEKINYFSDWVLLDSSNFGVPQKRERVIFIGSIFENKDKVEKCIDRLKGHKSKKITVYDAISDLEDKEEDFNFNHIFTRHNKEMIKKIKNTKSGDSVMKNFSDAFRRLYYDKQSPTVKENHGGVHVHPIKNRVLTPRELARLQSFPDWFLFKSNKSNILKQIGNAVPPKLSYEIARIVRKSFYDK